MRPKRKRRRVGRVVIVVPSLFTLANLFFGFWSMVLSAQGEFYRAGWYIVIAAVLDLLDGLSARVGKVDTRFGAELDSLVDVVSFGVAPAVLMYFLFLQSLGAFAWVFSFAYVVCVALRLARYNTQTGGEHHATFTGLPSPAAGGVLATYYPFTQTTFYQNQLADLPWSQILIFLMIALSVAMVSNAEYARLPRIGFRTARGIGGLVINVSILWFGLFNRDVFFFPLGLAYLSYGLGRAALLAVLERSDEPDDDGGHGSALTLHSDDADGQPQEPLKRRKS